MRLLTKIWEFFNNFFYQNWDFYQIGDFLSKLRLLTKLWNFFSNIEIFYQNWDYGPNFEIFYFKFFIKIEIIDKTLRFFISNFLSKLRLLTNFLSICQTLRCLIKFEMIDRTLRFYLANFRFLSILSLLSKLLDICQTLRFFGTISAAQLFSIVPCWHFIIENMLIYNIHRNDWRL